MAGTPAPSSPFPVHAGVHPSHPEPGLRILFLLFLVVPILEMYLLIRVGQWIGAWPTIGLVVLTAMIGIALLRQQGLSTLLRGRQRMDAGELPAQEMLEGLLLAIGGALLLTPGFATDAVGFCCLLPPTRKALVRALLRRGVVAMSEQGASFHYHASSTHGGPRGPGPDPRVRTRRDGTHVIDGEYERRDPPDS